MAKFYQHLEPGPTLGKVTRLKYVDDISDDELILYYFIDGSKCSSEFIADVEEENPIMNRRVMVELTSATNQWVFEKHELIPEKSDKMVASDGVIYEAPAPDVKLNAAAGGMTRTVEQNAKSGYRTDAKPPRKPARYTLEPIENYLLSLHPELETAPDDYSVQQAQKSQPVTKKPVVKQQPVQEKYEIEDFDKEFDNPVEQQPIQSTPVHKKPVAIPSKPVHSDTVLVDTNNVKTISVLIDGQKMDLSVDEFKSKMYAKQEQTMGEIKNEDVLIKNMIERSKCKNCKITMAITLELPPKELYDTIKGVYSDELADEFVKSVAMRIKQETLLASLSNGLVNYYNKNATVNKKV